MASVKLPSVSNKPTGIPTRTAAPTGRAGSKNSIGPKGGSSKNKAVVPNNSRKGETKLKTPHVKASLSKTAGSYFGSSKTDYAGSSTRNKSNNAGILRSKRVNHAMLRRTK